MRLSGYTDAFWRGIYEYSEPILREGADLNDTSELLNLESGGYTFFLRICVLDTPKIRHFPSLTNIFTEKIKVPISMSTKCAKKNQLASTSDQTLFLLKKNNYYKIYVKQKPHVFFMLSGMLSKEKHLVFDGLVWSQNFRVKSCPYRFENWSQTHNVWK